MVLRGDMALELGGDLKPAIGCTVCTTSKNLIASDEIIVCGPDILTTPNNCSYCRIALVQIDDTTLGTGDKLYNAIHSIEYFRYHVFPEGFMMRVSASSGRESVRVSKEAVKCGVTFEQIGNLMINELHKNKLVRAAKIIFITDQNAPYQRIQKNAELTNKITNTIDHMLKDAKMDCTTCSLSEVCDEVEGLKELHFGISSKSDGKPAKNSTKLGKI